MDDWLLVASMALVTFAIRYCRPLAGAFSCRRPWCEPWCEPWGYVPLVVLTASLSPQCSSLTARHCGWWERP